MDPPSSSNGNNDSGDSSTFALPFNAFFSLISFIASVNIALCIGASLTFATAENLLGSSADEDIARASKGAVFFAWAGAANGAALILTLLAQLLYTSPTFVGLFVKDDGNIRTSTGPGGSASEHGNRRKGSGYGGRSRVNTIGSLNLSGMTSERKERRHFSHDSDGASHHEHHNTTHHASDPEPQLAQEPPHGGFRDKWMRWLMGTIAWGSLALVAAGLGLIGEGMKVVDQTVGAIMEWMLLLFGLPTFLFWIALQVMVRVPYIERSR